MTKYLRDYFALPNLKILLLGCWWTSTKKEKKALSVPLYDNVHEFSLQRYMCQTYTLNERNIFLSSIIFLSSSFVELSKM
ncbi:hypothetical protein X975_07059, partial [Stegodyphus mimosarum]